MIKAIFGVLSFFIVLFLTSFILTSISPSLSTRIGVILLLVGGIKLIFSLLYLSKRNLSIEDEK